MTEPVDDDLVRTSQEAIARMVGHAQGFEASASDMPVQINSSDYFPAARARRSYGGGLAEAAERANRREEGDEDEHADLTRRAQNLEDLYAMFPRIGDGLYRIRVTRLEPRTYHSPDHGRFECAGVLGDFDEPISMDEFADRFGGQKYRVTVLGPARASDPQYDVRGNPLVRSLKSVEFSISGAPKPDFRPKAPATSNEVASTNAGRPQYGMPMNMGMMGGMNTEVERERLKNEYLRAEREASERAEANREARQAALQAAQAAMSAPTKLVEEVKQQSQQTFEVLRLQNEDLRGQAEKARQEAERLRTELITRQQDFERRVRDAENERTSQLKTEHEKELRRVTEESARAMERLTSTHRDDVARLTSQHALELQRAEGNASKEREMLVREAERRESSLSRDHDRERTATRETYEARISQLKDTYDARIRDLQLTFDRESSAVKEAAAREVASVRESRDREVESLRNQHDMQASVSRETTSLRVEMVNSEIMRLRDVEARLTQRISDLEAANAELREKHHKEPLEVINEAKNLLGEIGWAPAQEGAAPPTTEEAEGDWKKTLAKSALGLVDKIPEIAQTVLATRAQASQAQAQAKAEADRAEAMQLREAQQQQARASAARRQRALSAGPAAPPGLPPGADPYAGQVDPRAMRVAPPAARAQAPAPAVAPQPVQAPRRFPREVPPDALTEPSPETAPATPIQTDIQAVAAQDSVVEDPLAGLDQEKLAEFFVELDKAIREGVIPAGLWAKGFANKIGVPLAKSLVAQFPPEAVIELASGNEASVIPTRDGQVFVRAVWDEVGKM